MSDTVAVSWQDKAKCAGQPATLFFPAVGAGGSLTKAIEKARVVCLDCTVHTECYNYAFSNEEEHGIWGGVYFARNHKYSVKARNIRLSYMRSKFVDEYMEKQNA